MKSLRIVLFLAISGIFYSCSGSGSTGSLPAESGVIIPLAPYSVWVFDKTDYAPDGSLRSESVDSVKILPDTKLNFSTGITWYDYNHQLRLANLSDPNFPGLWRVNDSLIYPQLWFKYPANVGESFRWGPITQTIPNPASQNSGSVINLTGSFIVAAKNISVTAGDGKSHSCYKYESDFNDANNLTYLQTFEYFEPNVGQIMKEEYARDASNTLKLVSREKLMSVYLHH